MGSLSLTRRLFLLDTDLSHIPNQRGRILSFLTDGSQLTTVIDNMGSMPDGITVDHARGYMYWTNMGPSLKTNSGSIERSRLDGSEREIIVPTGTKGVFTPKQIVLAPRSQKLYWCDREGMKVMRSNLDGSEVEILISTGESAEDRLDTRRWCVGVTVDEEHGYFYWSQKGASKGNQGRIFRASTHTPADATPEARPDIQVVLDGLPEPIDLELDEHSQTLYWTDRGDPPRGNSLNRMFVGAKTEAVTSAPEILATRLHETIGLALDRHTHTAYVTDLAGGVYAINVDKKEKKVLFSELGDLTGIALAD